MNDPRSDQLEAQSSAGQDAPGVPAPFVPFDAATVLGSISDRILAVDNEWRLVYLNAAAQRMWNRDLSTLIGQPVEKLLDVTPDNPFRLAYLASKRANEPIAFSGYSEMIPGWIDVRGYPHAAGYTILVRPIDPAGAPQRVIADRSRDRAAARSINQRIFDTSIDLILVVDKDGNYLRVSPSCETILGYKPEEAIGRNGREFIYPEDLEASGEAMRTARDGPTSRTFECRVVHKEGHTVPMTWTCVWSEPDEQYFFIGRDMSERIVLESQLRQAQKMEAIGQLTGGVAHDFNNILTVIIGMTETLAAEVSGQPKLAPLVGAIDDAATRGAQLTQRMLAFARKQPLQARDADLNDIITRTATMLRRTLGEHIAVKIVLAEDLWTTLVDGSQMEDAILNLAVNARDAMPNGGHLVIETGNAVLDEEYASQNVECYAGEYVSLSITDTGFGMPPEIVERVFEPFFTTKEVGQGTGLGLSMVYGFVRQSRGHIKIYSETGHGTNVRLYFPRAAPAKAQPSAPAAAPAVRAAGHETILVVEDSESVRTVAVAILRTFGYRVLEAGDGPSALAILEGPGDIDLLFTDLVMPNGMNGQDLLKRARALRPDMKALLTSGYSENFLESRTREEVGVPLLNKPYRAQQLGKAIRDVLDAEGKS